MAESGPHRPAVEPVSRTFCGKPYSELLALFEGQYHGQRTFICNECVMLFAKDIAKRQTGR
jgi:hypothetical protein